MSTLFAPGLQVNERARVSRIRELPLNGDIIVQPGDRVAPTTVVARASLPGELIILRAAESLGIQPFEVARGLKCAVGDQVAVGTVLCEHVGLFGLFKSRFASPLDGVVELIAEEIGHIAVRLPSREIELSAYLAGTVTAVQAGRAVTIEAHSTFVQGIFGIGGERSGTVKLLPVAPGDTLSLEAIQHIGPGQIAIGGTNPSAEVLRAAAARGAAGLIVGSIDDQALTGYLGFDLGIALTGDEPVSMSVIVTEGFGNIPMSSRLHELFKRCDGSLASINGATQVRAGAVRPEIIVYREASANAPAASANEQRMLAIGAKVRMIRFPYFGDFGEIVELPKELVRLDTGAEARVLRAKRVDGTVVTVPRANVEIV